MLRCFDDDDGDGDDNKFKRKPELIFVRQSSLKKSQAANG